MATGSTFALSIGIVILFYAIAALFFWKNKKNVSIQNKIIVLYRSVKAANFISRIAKKCPRFWRVYGYIGIPASFVGMFLVFGLLAVKVAELLLKPSMQPVVQLVLPGPSTFSAGPVQFVSIWYFIISIFVILVVHEGSHGVVAESFGIKLKSAGVGLMAILPLAFVEPDEKKLSKKPLKEQLAVYGAGSFGNFCAAFVAILLSIFLIAPAVAAVTTSNGVYVSVVSEGLPAQKAGLVAGDIITAVDGKAVQSSEDLVNILSAKKPGDVALFITSAGGNKQITTIANPSDASKAYVGMQFKSNMMLKPDIQAKFGKAPWVLTYIAQLFYWIFVLNLGIGIMNVLPLGPLDGGKMVQVAFNRGFKKKTAHRLFSVVSAMSLFLLLFSLVGPYLIGAFVA